MISRLLFWSILAIGLLSAVFVAGLYSGATKNEAFALYRDLRTKTRVAVRTVMNEAPVLVRARPEWHLQPARHAGSGVTINETQDNDLVLLAGFFDDSNELRLIRRDGSIVARWPVAFSEIFTDTRHIQEPPATDWNIDTHGALIQPDGSVVFVFEYMGLVKLDRCGQLEWKVATPAHHSVERAESGGYWVPGRKYVLEEATSRFPPFTVPYSEDTVLRISPDGKVLEERSLVELFYRAGKEAWLTVRPGTEPNQNMDGEILHLNKVAELDSVRAANFPMFAAGDLLLSIRGLNMILVTDPALQRIKWWRVGP
ncbi:MAG: arylsulfotransferase family protein, partial [Pseudomonadota bacterium]|nr:arylsulfotransferase family protein [Pseudomonadota bacterium]